MTVRALVVGALALAGCDRVFSLDERPPDAPVPIDAPLSPDWIQIAAGDDTTCGIRDGGTLWCWGYNKFGQVGINSTLIQVPSPAQVAAPTTWSQVSVGGDHTCGLQSDGSLWCWGNNAQGQLGTGGLSNQAAPVRVDAATWSHVSAGIEHTCGIRGDGSLWCWGDNPDGRVGNGSQVDQATPIEIAPATTWLAVSAGKSHTCGISMDSRRWCWGDNGGGQLGLGALPDQLIPVVGPETGAAAQWKEIVASADVSCGLLQDGTARCWGSNAQGQVGDGTSGNNRSSPTAVLGAATSWVTLDSTGRFVCGRRSDDTLWCWGDLESVFGLPHATQPVQLSVEPTTAFAAGRAHTCRIGADRGMWCVGDGSVGQRGDGTEATLVPAQVPGQWLTVSAGSVSTCAIASPSRQLHCWGANTSAQIGDGTNNRRLSPVAIAATLNLMWTEVAFGDRHGCARDSSGDVYCWGNNTSGSLGVMGVTYRTSPLRVGGPYSRLTVETHACAFNNSNALYCWGRNQNGQLGTGTTTTAQTPTMISGTWAEVAAGDEFSCAISTTNSRVYCTGANNNAQLGDGNRPTPRSSYGVTADMTAMSAVFAGYDHACALATTGRRATCWGDNGDGELGDGTRTDRATPVPVAGDHAWSTLALGNEHTCGIRMDGALMCWGDNSRGQLGVDSYQPKVMPTQVGAETTWTLVTAGDDHACALKADQSLWCWGDNRDGQLGTGGGWSGTWTYVPRPPS